MTLPQRFDHCLARARELAGRERRGWRDLWLACARFAKIAVALALVPLLSGCYTSTGVRFSRLQHDERMKDGHYIRVDPYPDRINVIVGVFPSTPPKVHVVAATLTDGSGHSEPCRFTPPKFMPGFEAYQFAGPIPSVFLRTQHGPKAGLLEGRYTFALRYTVGARFFTHSESFRYRTETSIYSIRLPGQELSEN